LDNPQTTSKAAMQGHEACLNDYQESA